MKFKAQILWLLVFFTLTTKAYNWIPYGPQGQKITNICFAYNGHGILCAENGFYIYQDDMEWHFQASGLPVIEVVYFTPQKLLLAMGAGTYSDGIYTYDLQTGEFQVVEWLYKPAFLRYYEHLGVYYAGQLEGGLHLSMNGSVWYNLSLFDDFPCNDIAFYEEHIVISSNESTIDNILLSDDGGSTWQNAANAGYFSKLEFNGSGDLFALIPGMSNSAGLFKSADYGFNWEPVNWEFFISSLACDPFGNVLVGWDNGYGVAKVEPELWNPPFVHIEEGLPDTHVHAVRINPAMSAPSIFVCTDSGAFYSYDYLTAKHEKYTKNEFLVYPNPAPLNRSLSIEVPGKFQSGELELIDLQGNVLWRSAAETSTILLPGLPLKPGVYFCQLRKAGHTSTKKLIIF